MKWPPFTTISWASAVLADRLAPLSDPKVIDRVVLRSEASTLFDDSTLQKPIEDMLNQKTSSKIIPADNESINAQLVELQHPFGPATKEIYGSIAEPRSDRRGSSNDQPSDVDAKTVIVHLEHVHNHPHTHRRHHHYRPRHAEQESKPSTAEDDSSRMHMDYHLDSTHQGTPQEGASMTRSYLARAAADELAQPARIVHTSVAIERCISDAAGAKARAFMATIVAILVLGLL